MKVHPNYIIVCPDGRTLNCGTLEEVRWVLARLSNPRDVAVYGKVDYSKIQKTKGDQ